MILCSDDCIPCCDFCIYAVHGTLEIDGTTGPIGCDLHLNVEHQEIADGCGYCEDFHCFFWMRRRIEMIIIETCPRCGHYLHDYTICTYPPIPVK